MKSRYRVKTRWFFYLAMLFAATMIHGCGKMEEDVLEEVEITDTVRWFNTSCALLTEMNSQDYNLFGGAKNTSTNQEEARKHLDRWWGVTDRDSADKTLDWILKDGHRGNFASMMKTLERDGIGELPLEERQSFLMDNYNLGGEKYASLYLGWYEMYEEYGEDAIAGWDCCRAMSLPGYYYLAGYYTKEEALDKSLEIAEMVQPMFESWDDLMESYLRGYEYWSEGSSEKRRSVYEKLKKKSGGPYDVDFAMQFEKTW